jgi:hypothetical protein
MNSELYHKRNGRKIEGFYPKHGNRNVLRRVKGIKVASFTGPNGRGVKIQEENGKYTSVSVNKWVASL